MRRPAIIAVLVAAAGLLLWFLLGRDGKTGKLPPASAQARGSAAGASSFSATSAPGGSGGSGTGRHIDLNVDRGNPTPTYWRFDASKSTDEQDGKLARFIFNFDDGTPAITSEDGIVEHDFAYVTDASVQNVERKVQVTGVSKSGASQTLEIPVAYPNIAGIEAARGRVVVETAGCMLFFEPLNKTWACTTNIRNTGDQAVTFADIAVSVRRPNVKLPAHPTVKDLEAAGLAFRMPAKGVLPDRLEPKEAREVTMRFPEAKVPDDALAMSIVVQGKAGDKPARILMQPVLRPKDTWVSDEARAHFQEGKPAEFHEGDPGAPKPPR